MTLDHDTLFKATDGYQATNGGKYTYRKGQWTRRITDLRPYESGFHLARGPQVLGWLAPTLWVAETRGRVIEQPDKLVCESVRVVERLDRWNDMTARLFAADCAEAALLGERASGREPDERSWAAVEAARAFAHGEIGDAARDAARAAARDAAWDAAWAAQFDRLLLHLTGADLPPVTPLYGPEGSP